MNVLAISVHPDDETLGCGGTLLKHRAAGDTVNWVIVTEAQGAAWNADVVAAKAGELQRVAAAYGMTRVEKLGFPAARLDTVAQVDLMTKLREAIESIHPEVVYLVHEGDVHSDHRALFQAAMSVLKPFHLRRLGVRRVLSYETLSSSDQAAPSPSRAFVPTIFVDVTRHLEHKLEIMAMYESETQPALWPRGSSAIRALARARGATMAVEYAEAFMLMREHG
jgi:LmbE family N-acetylglucosaminyl deacetylase